MISNAFRFASIAALALLAVPVPAAAAGGSGGGGGGGIDLTLHGGVDKYDAVSLKSGLSSTDFTDEQQLRDASQSYGATLVVRLGILSAGALVELGRLGKPNTTTAIGALGGLNLQMGRLQLDALAELGGHRYGDALYNPDVVADSDRSDWLAYVGLRPGVAVHLGQGGNILLGLWGFARWDLMRKDVAVTLASGGGEGAYELGGTQFGGALRLGISF